MDEDFTLTLLELKTHPEWQRGLWNGVGGKIELGEGVFNAMERECFEECGLRIPHSYWTLLAVLNGCNPDGSQYEVNFLYCRINSEQFMKAEQRTDEQLQVFTWHSLPNVKTTAHIKWLLEYARAQHVSYNGQRLHRMPLRLLEAPAAHSVQVAVWNGETA